MAHCWPLITNAVACGLICVAPRSFSDPFCRVGNRERFARNGIARRAAGGAYQVGMKIPITRLVLIAFASAVLLPAAVLFSGDGSAVPPRFRVVALAERGGV